MAATGRPRPVCPSHSHSRPRRLGHPCARRQQQLSGSSEYELAVSIARRPGRACVPSLSVARLCKRRRSRPAGRGICGRGLSTCVLAFVSLTSPIRSHEINRPDGDRPISSAPCMQAPITAVAHWRGAAGYYCFGWAGRGGGAW
jgi:hypothetical protein